MVTYESKFIGDFKLGDNIVFNLSILKCLYKCRAEGNAAQKRYLQKPITLLNISIIEALLYDFHLRINTFTREGVGLPQKILDAIRSKQIDEFEKYIASARKNDFFDLKDTVFYDKLDELRKLRNRFHIQNTKNHFEKDDSHAFSEARMPGCTNCYAMRMARRLEAMGQPKYAGTTRMSGGRPKWNGVVRIDEDSLLLPMNWKVGRMIFVNSMSDLFHEDVPLEFINRVFATMRKTPQHTYQILTKRAERLEELSPKLAWPQNVWMGVSVENENYMFRIDHLRRTQAAIKFLSLEPLLGPLDNLDLIGIDWVIAGGESGPHARPVEPGWIRSIRDQCFDSGVAFHFKQWGGVNKKKTGRILDGRTWDDFPAGVVV